MEDVLVHVIAVLFTLLVTGWQQGRTKFTEITVERINVVEKSGKMRLIIANGNRSPGSTMDGIQMPVRSQRPGLIFYNDEGDEAGGLLFGGSRQGERFSAGAQLAFDQYKQDQTVAIRYQDENGKRTTGLQIWDRPETPLSKDFQNFLKLEQMPESPEKERLAAEVDKRQRSATRVFVGKQGNEDAVVVLSDANGRPRLRFLVTPSGQSRIEFLDGTGRIARSFSESPE